MSLPNLPHAFPFLLIDCVVAVEAGRRAAARRGISGGDPLLDAAGQLPVPLVAEMLAQCAGLAAVEAGDGEVRLISLSRFACPQGLRAGDVAEIVVTMVRRFGAVAKPRGRIRVAGRLRACGEVVLHIAPAPTSGASPRSQTGS